MTEHSTSWWLCCENFTAADISLCVLLERLHNVGLSSNLWSPDKRPHLCQYFARAQLRASYVKTMTAPTTATLCAMFSHSCPVMIAGAVLLVALITGYALVRRQ